MILVRISGVKGSCKIPGYDRSQEAWFPADSVSFGLDSDAPDEEEAFSTSDLNDQLRKMLRKAGSDDELSTVSIDKQVDSATCDLMFYAMQDRLKTKSTSEPLSADIHFVETAGAEGKAYPYLRVHLENVLIKSWGFEASEDDRPTESVTLKFDRAAMQYHSTADGKTFDPAGKKGWDQIANQPWTPKTEFFP